MARYNMDGSVIPNQLNSNSGASYNNRFGLYPGVVKSVIYADDDQNKTGDVEYVVIILGQKYFNVPDIRHAGGIHNSHIRIRKGVDSVKLGAASPLSLSALNPGADTHLPEHLDGEAVWCLFIRGNSEFPVIIGSRNSPRSSENPDYVEPTEDMGIFERYEFNGVEFMIDKDGNFTLSQVGQKNAKLAGAFPGSSVPKVPPFIENPEAILPSQSVVSFNNNGDLEVTIGDELTMIFTKLTKKLEIAAGLGTTIVVDGSTDSIKASTVTGSTLKLANGQVGLGSSGGELVDLLAQVTDQLIDTMTKLSTTMGNLGFPISTAADFTAMINKMVPIKTKIAAIKGGI